jgi:hypothetical protein
MEKKLQRQNERLDDGHAEKAHRVGADDSGSKRNEPQRICGDGGRRPQMEAAEFVPKSEPGEPELNQKESQENGRR